MEDKYFMFNPLSVSSKFAICGLPLRLDTYKQCTYNCEYCFANKRVIGPIREDTANTEWLRNKFEKVYDKKEVNNKDFLEVLLKNRITLHAGGQSDCFQPREQTEHKTREIIELCNEYNQHILFSTKTDQLYDVPCNPEYHTFQLSISNMVNYFEDNVPSIHNRILFFDDLKDQGYLVGIRIQPFIPEVSELEAIIDCFSEADHFTIEGLKLVPQQIEHNKILLEDIGLSREDFKQMGLLNLYPEIRLWYYAPLIEYFEDHGISYSIADNDLHYLSNNKCCCGDLLIHKQTNFHNTCLLQEKGKHYQLNDVLDRITDYRDCVCKDLFTSNRRNGCNTVEEFYHERFTKKSSPFSPKFQYYEDYQQSNLDDILREDWT